jgi:predicted nucleotidyltransferase
MKVTPTEEAVRRRIIADAFIERVLREAPKELSEIHLGGSVARGDSSPIEFEYPWQELQEHTPDLDVALVFSSQATGFLHRLDEIAREIGDERGLKTSFFTNHDRFKAGVHDGNKWLGSHRVFSNRVMIWKRNDEIDFMRET